MGIGINSIYNIEKNPGEITFKVNHNKVHTLIRKYIKGINDNEIERFMAFQFNNIIDEIPTSYFRNKNYKAIDKYIEQGIKNHSSSWMQLHSDEAIKRGLR